MQYNYAILEVLLSHDGLVTSFLVDADDNLTEHVINCVEEETEDNGGGNIQVSTNNTVTLPTDKGIKLSMLMHYFTNSTVTDTFGAVTSFELKSRGNTDQYIFQAKIMSVPHGDSLKPASP